MNTVDVANARCAFSLFVSDPNEWRRKCEPTVKVGALSSIPNMAPATPTSDFAIGQVNRLLSQLAFQVSRAIKSSDAEAIDDLRFAIRKFTQALIIFKPYFPAKEVKKVRRRLGRVMELAGEVRNCDITAKLLSRSRAPAAMALRLRIETQRRESQRELTRLLRRWVARSWSSKWRHRLVAGVAVLQTAGRTPIETMAQGILPRMAEDFLRHGNEAAEPNVSPEKLHQFQIAGKKFRDTLEIFTALYGTKLKAWLDQIRAVQTLLGEFNDCETVRGMIAGWAGSETVQRQLKKRERRKKDEFARQWHQGIAAPGNVGRWTEYLPDSGTFRVADTDRPTTEVLTAGAGT